jgi:hypothetical protein
MSVSLSDAELVFLLTLRMIDSQALNLEPTFLAKFARAIFG